MALDFANAGQLPTPTGGYSQEQLRQAFRVIELYFSQLDSAMWNHADRYTAKQFVAVGAEGEAAVGFYGGRFFGDGNYLSKDIQRFVSLADQAAVAIDVTTIVSFGVAEQVNSITLVPPGKMTVSLPGLYQIDYHLGFTSNIASQQAVNVWLLKNGVLVPNSNAQFTLTALNVAVMATYSMILTLAAGDFIQIGWAPSNVALILKTKAAFAGAPGVAPPIPATPSAVVNMALLGAPIPADAVLPLPRRLRPP